MNAMLQNYAAPAAPELHRAEDGAIRCLACAHRCRIAPERTGICGVRFNRDKVLHAPQGYVAGLAADPIEKKPFYHVLPGSEALSYGMIGCNFQCAFCQNWMSSQYAKEETPVPALHVCTAESIVEQAVKHQAPVVVSTYNEPLITSEWSARIFDLAGERGLLRGYVSNGFASEEAIAYLLPRIDLFKVDLKCFTESGYRSLGGRLEPVLSTIEALVSAGVWVEVVTLVVPGFNDSAGELADAAAFLARISPDIPWHVTAFFPTYKMTDRPPTEQTLLHRAYEAGKDAGLHYVYQGNRAGRAGNCENTYCAQCNALLVERIGFRVVRNRLSDGCCPDCSASIPGRWNRK